MSNGPIDDVYYALGYTPPVLRVDVAEGESVVTEVEPARPIEPPA